MSIFIILQMQEMKAFLLQINFTERFENQRDEDAKRNADRTICSEGLITNY